MKFEYLEVQLYDLSPLLVEDGSGHMVPLNTLGHLGWELVAIRGIIAIFKRRVES